MDEQIAWSFDSITQNKTLRGFEIAFLVGALFGAGDFLVEHRETMDFAHAALEGLAVAALSGGINAVRQFIKGVTPNVENLQ